MDIFYEDEITPQSQLYLHNTIKEEPGNINTSTNQVRAFEEPTKGFQRSKVGTRG
jgi:hypothetical protein